MNKSRITAALCALLCFFSVSAEDKQVSGKHYTGWIKSSAAEAQVEKGNIRVISSGNGEFCIYAINPDGEKAVPLFSALSGHYGSYFLLKYNNLVYRLQDNGSVRCSSSAENNTLVMTYNITDAADVTVTFTLEPDDAVKIEASVVNRGKTAAKMALKFVMDTYLGETTDTHFSTAAAPEVNTEKTYEGMSQDMWILSQNGQAAVQLLLYGADITAPDTVSVVNKDKLDGKSWVPEAALGSGFNSVLSYNNSGIAVTWPEAKLSVKDPHVYRFYIFSATGGETPGGKMFLWKQQRETQSAAAAVQGSAETAAAAVSEPAADASGVIDETVKAQAASVQSADVQKGSEKPDVVFDVASVTEDQLDPAYVQDLINRINALEADGKDINRTELLRLNAELDAILAKLRQQ